QRSSAAFRSSSAMDRPMAPRCLAEGRAPILSVAAMLLSLRRIRHDWATPMIPAYRDGLTPRVLQLLLISLSAMNCGSIRGYVLKGLTILISHYSRRPCLAVMGISDWSFVRNSSISSTEHNSLLRTLRVALQTTKILES